MNLRQLSAERAAVAQHDFFCAIAFYTLLCRRCYKGKRLVTSSFAVPMVTGMTDNKGQRVIQFRRVEILQGATDRARVLSCGHLPIWRPINDFHSVTTFLWLPLKAAALPQLRRPGIDSKEIENSRNRAGSGGEQGTSNSRI